MDNQQSVVRNKVLSQEIRESYPAKTVLLLLSGFIILSVAYYYIFRTVPRQSDLANTLLAGHDMSRGNWRLKGWWLGADNFVTTDIIFYAVLVKCLGLTPQIMFYLPAMLWAALALLSLALAQGGIAPRNRGWAMAAVATPISLPIIRDHAGIAQISESPMHIGTIVYVLVSFLLVKKVLSGKSYHLKSMLIAYSLIMALAVFADPVAIFIGALPIIGVTTFSIFQGRDRFLHGTVLLLTVLTVIFGRILVGLNSSMGGFETCTQVSLSFINFADLGKSIAVAIHYFFVLFGCDFFGKEISASLVNDVALSLIRLPFLAFLIVALAHVGKKFLLKPNATATQWPTGEGDYLDAILAVGFTVNVVLAVLSPQLLVDTVMTARYLFPALIFGAILIARTLNQSRLLGAFYCLALTASLAFTGVAYAQLPAGIDPKIEALSTWLSNNNLTSGFGPYWSSSIVTAQTANRIRIRALASDGQGKVKPFEFVAKKSWYQYKETDNKRGVFVLANDIPQPPDFYSEADVIRTLGEPREKYHVSSFVVNVYDVANERLRSIFLSSANRR